MPSFSVSISPAQVELVVKPGTTLTQAFDVENTSDTSLVLNTSVLPWQPLGSSGSVTYDNISPNPHIEFSLNNANLKLGQPFTLKPGEKRQLVLKIKTDAAAPSSDAYQTLFISQAPDTALGSGNSSALGRLGAHLLLSLSSTENLPAKAKILDFKASPRFIDSFFTPVTFSGEIQNLTDYYFKPGGKITITKGGKQIREIDLDPQNVLAHSSRQLKCVNLESNIQHPTSCSLSPPFWPGAYHATLKLDPAVDAKTAELTFFVFPYYLTLILLLLASVSFLFFRRSSHKL